MFIVYWTRVTYISANTVIDKKLFATCARKLGCFVIKSRFHGQQYLWTDLFFSSKKQGRRGILTCGQYSSKRCRSQPMSRRFLSWQWPLILLNNIILDGPNYWFYELFKFQPNPVCFPHSLLMFMHNIAENFGFFFFFLYHKSRIL